MPNQSGRSRRTDRADPGALGGILDLDDAQSQREHGRRHLVDLFVAERAAVEERTAVANERYDRRLSEPKGLGELLLDRARRARELRERKRATADAGDRLLDLAADELGEPRRAGAHGLDRLVRASAASAPSRATPGTERERALERSERQLVGAERALERVAAQPLDELGAADDDARLRPAEELVAREADEVGTRARGSPPGSARRRSDRARRSRGRRRAEGRARRATSASSREHAGAPRSRRRGSSTGARGEGGRCRDRSPARSRPRACGSSCRPRRVARPSAQGRPGCGSRRRSRSARPARRRPRDPPRARRGRGARRRRCC